MSLPADIENQIQLLRVLVDQVSQISGMSLLELVLLAVPAMTCALGDREGCPCAQDGANRADWSNRLKAELLRSVGRFGRRSAEATTA